MKYILSYLAAISLSDVSVKCSDCQDCHGAYSPVADNDSYVEEEVDDSPAPPDFAACVAEEGDAPVIEHMNPLNLTLPVLKVIMPKGFQLVFEKDVPEVVDQIECIANVNNYLTSYEREHTTRMVKTENYTYIYSEYSGGEYPLKITGKFTKSNSVWSYVNTEYVLNAKDQVYVVVRWGCSDGREYFDEFDYRVNETDTERAMWL